MIEFHVDDHSQLQVIADRKHPRFGGKISVQLPPGSKPIILVG
jgi:hypothetical protein